MERHRKQVFIIAEAGVNHNGNPDLAFKLVDVAVESGADAVKFQTFKTENIVTEVASKAMYQQHHTDATESQFAMLKRLELTYETHRELFDYCLKRGITFLSTAFDFQSLDFLVNDIGLTTLKVPSGEITNAPLLLAHAQTGCDLIMSTGMSTLQEVQDALGVIAFGLLYGADASMLPSRQAFKEAYLSEQAQILLKQKVTLLHCTSEYPAPPQDINLNAMLSLKDEFGLQIGYSDHSEGIVVSAVASALGASLIEKHFTLDKTLPGPDHKASLSPEELKNMVEAVRISEQIMGDGIKSPMASELEVLNVARKSLVAAVDIEEGEKFTKENLQIKRPGTGISPMEYWDILDTFSQKKYNSDEVIH